MPQLNPSDPLAKDVEAVARLAVVPTLLRVVAESTGLRFTAVARVTREQWVACAVHDELGLGLAPGDTLDVATTLCAQVRDLRAPIAIDHASADPVYCGHPSPRRLGFESYVAVPIFLSDGAWFGTIFGLDTEPKAVDRPPVIAQVQLHAELVACALDLGGRESLARAGQRRLESFVKGAPLAIAVFRGPDLVYDMVNDSYAELIGHREVVGRAGREVFPDLRHAIWDELDRVYATGEPRYAPATPSEAAARQNPAAPTRYFDWVAQPTRGADGAIDGVIFFATDVTDKVEAHRALERRNRELDGFAAIASHDLKTPLRGIMHLAQWVREDLGDAVSAEVAGHLEQMRERAAQMSALIDGLLEYARAGDVRETLADIDVGALLGEVVALLPIPAEARVEVGPMPTLHGSPVALQQVFHNLVGNALVHAGRPDPTIAVTAEEDAGAWIFAVEDDGRGVPVEHRERIWKLFESLAAKERGNTGLGLAIVRKVVEVRGGRGAVETGARGGARFAFSWPKREPRSEG